MAKNITITRANSQTVNLTATDASSGSAIKSGDKIYFTAKPTYDNDATDAAAVIAKTMNADDVLNPDTGLVTFVITASEANVVPGKYVYDLVLKQSDGDRITLLSGKLTVKPAVTLREVA
ncbi:hypothetical protein IJI55_00840 [Candidatus Saccharibacteria bacterium]|nr:hypothetical protein [Candidatus Saccharibacteria bacterium]